MLVLANTGLVRALKREISTLYPRVKSSVLTEALARGLGFETHAVMLSRIPQPTNMTGHSLFSGAGMPCVVDDAAFLGYLDGAGVWGCKARPEPVYSGLWPTTASERPVTQAALRADKSMSAIAESQGEALLCKLAHEAHMHPHLLRTLPENPIFDFEEPIGSHVGIRLKGYMVETGFLNGEPYGWTRSYYSPPSLGSFDGELARGYVERDLETLCRLAARTPALSGEHAPTGFNHLWFGMSPVRVHWSEGMQGTSIILFPRPEGGFHSAQRFEIQWSDSFMDPRKADCKFHDLTDADQTLLSRLDSVHASKRFATLENILRGCPILELPDRTGLNVFRQAQRFRDVMEENHRDAPVGYTP